MIMKVQASGILILIACILTGCGKSMKDVAGVYETSEIKKPFNTHTYDSTTWVLDLAESGTFTLTKKKFRKFIEDKKYQPRPMDGMEVSGKWELDRDSVICSWSGLTFAEEQELAQLEARFAQELNNTKSSLTKDEEEEPTLSSPFNRSVIFDVQTSGDVIAVFPASESVSLHPIDKLRFKRAE
jgi:hypothetical protein